MTTSHCADCEDCQERESNSVWWRGFWSAIFLVFAVKVGSNFIVSLYEAGVAEGQKTVSVVEKKGEAK